MATHAFVGSCDFSASALMARQASSISTSPVKKSRMSPGSSHLPAAGGGGDEGGKGKRNNAERVATIEWRWQQRCNANRRVTIRTNYKCGKIKSVNRTIKEQPVKRGGATMVHHSSSSSGRWVSCLWLASVAWPREKCSVQWKRS